MLRFKGSQRARHDLGTEQKQQWEAAIKYRESIPELWSPGMVTGRAAQEGGGDIHTHTHIYMYIYKVKVPQSYPTLCDSMDYIVHGIFQIRILEWVAYPFSRGSSWLRNQTEVSDGFFISWGTIYRYRYLYLSLYTHIHTMADSHCFTAETNTTLQKNTLQLKNKIITKKETLYIPWLE